MLIQVEHLEPGMVLARDIELKAGSFLITRKDLGRGVLTGQAIESIRRFSHQFVPHEGKVAVEDDVRAMRKVKEDLREELCRIERQVSSGNLYPSFLSDVQIKAKVMRVMEILFSNPDMVILLYEAKYSDSISRRPADLVMEHQIRVTLLAIALGMQMKLGIVALVSLGAAALLHDISLLTRELSARMQRLDDFESRQVEDFVQEHQQKSVQLIGDHVSFANNHLRFEVLKIVRNHHHREQEKAGSTSSEVFYFVDLLDEMVCLLPHSIRYNFTGSQILVLGERFRKPLGLIELISGLKRLWSADGGIRAEIVNRLAILFGMEALLQKDFTSKLHEIIALCPSSSASANPPVSGNFMPRTIYCKRCDEEKFFCPHLLYVNVEVKDTDGSVRKYLKCGVLDKRLKELLNSRD